MSPRPRLLLVTDPAYPGADRRYGDEDVWISTRLRTAFDLAMVHPGDAVALMDDFDLVLVRNSGPAIHYRADYEAFRAHALATGARVSPQLTGRGDQLGKDYLVELTRAGFPVIPTVDSRADLASLPEAKEYAVKPVLGADSVGLRFAGRDELERLDLTGQLVQPRIDFRYEVSFYVLDRQVRYALYAPDPARRWELTWYEPTPEDLAFAEGFVDWNGVERGIERIDACRTQEGELLLVEVEDLNPYLSLDLLPEPVRDDFVAALLGSLRTQLP